MVVLGLLNSAAADAACYTFHTLNNNTTADATAVMDNFNYTLQCPNFTGNVGIGTSVLTYPLNLGNGSPITGVNDPTQIDLGATYGTTTLGRNSKIRIFDVTGSPNLVYGIGVSAGLFELTAAYDADFAFFKNDTTPTELVRIKNNGNVGIGTSTPTYSLSIGDVSTVVGAADPTKIDLGATYGTSAVGKNLKIRLFDVTSSPTSTYGIGLSAALFELTTGYDGDFAFFKNGSTPSELVRIKNNGNVGIGRTSPGQKLDVNGTIRQSNCTTAGTLSTNTSGDIICTSDARLKNILGNYDGGLNAIRQITPQRFKYKPTATDPVETFVHAGFIAQDVQRAIPEAVALQRSGYYSLDTTAILAASVNAIKQLKAANDQQAIEIQRLKIQMSALERKLTNKIARN